MPSYMREAGGLRKTCSVVARKFGCMHVCQRIDFLFLVGVLWAIPYVHGLESFFVIKVKARTYCFDGNRDGVEVAHRIA